MLHRLEFMQASAGAIAAVGLPGAARAAAWKTIDAQVHSYERNRPERPWAGTLVGPDEMTGDSGDDRSSTAGAGHDWALIQGLGSALIDRLEVELRNRGGIDGCGAGDPVVVLYC
jgi:hypothetical protein